MQDRDILPEAEGNINGAGDGVRLNEAQAARRAAIASNRAFYTAPMDHSYRAKMGGDNGNRGGARRGFSSSYAPVDPDPLPVPQEDAASRVFAFVEDLFFLAKIQETGRKMNVKVEFVKNEKDLADRLTSNGDEKPSLIIFDLNNANAKPLTLIPKLKKQAEEEHVDHRLPFPRAGRFEAESPRSGL